MTTFLLIVLWLAVVGASYVAVTHALRLQRVRTRLAAEHRAAFEPAEGAAAVPDEEMSWLRRWLFLAGYRRAEAPQVFLFLAVGAFVVGFFLAWAMRSSALLAEMMAWLYAMPGGVGEIFTPILVIAPWFLWILFASVPWLHIRASRRRRVREVEEDLPITLQILATLARAGLGFDAALVRVLESSDEERVLPSELHTFRAEVLSGVPRVQAWRRLARRISVPATSIFVSAMVHSEQVGGGLSDVLEQQALDVQGHRRERALVEAQALPVKLVFPLVICFLPGIFVWTLGPAIHQFLEVIDSVLREGGG